MRRAIGLVVVVMVAAVCAPAQATLVTVDSELDQPSGSCKGLSPCFPPVVVIRAGSGERNAVTVASVAGGVVVEDAGAPVVPGVGCTSRPEGGVLCTSGRLKAVLLDGDDRFEVLSGAYGAVVVEGGDGADVVVGANDVAGGAGDDTLTGTPYGDRLDAGPGRDTVAGGAGDDTIVDGGPAEADRLDGGPGSDVLAFEREDPVVVDLAARPQAGGTGAEGNELAGFDRAAGGAGDDVLRGDPAAEPPSLVLPTLAGGDGDDRLVGRGTRGITVVGGRGDDRITGTAGGDELFGEAGDDRVDGGRGRDLVHGGTGDDDLTGGPGRDRLSGGTGRDVLRARDGVRSEGVSCGPGRDRAVADRRDRTRSCERPRRRR
jgi:Ca2+-binding RTX toxin-like protein